MNDINYPSNQASDSTGQPPEQTPVSQPAPLQGEVSNKIEENTNENHNETKELAREFRTVEIIQIAINGVLGLIGLIALCIYHGQLVEMRRATEKSGISADAAKIGAEAAKSAAETAAASLVLQERPWVKIRHRIVQPLTFGVQAWKGPVATMIIEDTLENVGPSVALNVFSWEDIIPIDADHSLRTARLRQSQWCDANRHPNPSGLTGYMLFPKDNPWVQHSTVGPNMETVLKAAAASPRFINGKVGFVLVGCVCYRSFFEPKDGPTHQTRFIYYLGNVEKSGGFNPYVPPSGIAEGLQLIATPDGFFAD